MILPFLYKRATDKKRINQWTVEIEDNKYRTISGFVGMTQTTSNWTVCAAKTYCTAAEQADKEARALYRKRVEKGFTPSIEACDEEAYFQPMLAKDWLEEKSNIRYPLYTQPKLDGIRCIVNSEGMWSRNGKRIVSAPHIFRDLEPLFSADPSLIFDGELYADKFANDFNRICSIVKKTKPTQADIEEAERNIQYHIYDLPSCKSTFFDRIVMLNLKNLPPSCITVPTYIVNNENEVNSYYERFVDAGYEGQIIRRDALYENKRTRSLLKHKHFITEEYEILDVLVGEGNKQNMAGAFLMRIGDTTFKATPKFSWDECIEILQNKHEYIGKMGTVRYFNLTPDGIPRFPYMIAVRDYE